MFFKILQLVGVALGIALSSTPSIAQQVQIFVGTDYPFSTAYVATAKGFFAKYGVEATVNTFNSGADAVQAMRSAKAGFVMAGDIPSAKTWRVGDVVGVAPATWDDSSVSILAVAGITKPSDLKGKKIAVVKGSSHEIFLLNYLRLNGMAESDVDLINLSPGDMPAAIANGDIAAYIGNQLTTAAGLRAMRGSHYLTDGTKGFGVNRIILSAARATAEKNPKQVVAVIRALLEAQQFIKNQPAEAYPIIAKAIGTSLDKVKAQIVVFNFDMDFNSAFVDDMTTKTQLATHLGMMSAPIDWKTQWMTKFEQEIDPNLVSANLSVQGNK